MIIHLEKQNAVADPVRGLPDRREKGINKKEPPRGTNYKNECENNSPRKRNQKYQIQWGKKTPEQNKNKKASKTIIDTDDQER